MGHVQSDLSEHIGIRISSIVLYQLRGYTHLVSLLVFDFDGCRELLLANPKVLGDAYSQHWFPALVSTFSTHSISLILIVLKIVVVSSIKLQAYSYFARNILPRISLTSVPRSLLGQGNREYEPDCYCAINLKRTKCFWEGMPSEIYAHC